MTFSPVTLSSYPKKASFLGETRQGCSEWAIWEAGGLGTSLASLELPGQAWQPTTPSATSSFISCKMRGLMIWRSWKPTSPYFWSVRFQGPPLCLPKCYTHLSAKKRRCSGCCWPPRFPFPAAHPSLGVTFTAALMQRTALHGGASMPDRQGVLALQQFILHLHFPKESDWGWPPTHFIPKGDRLLTPLPVGQRVSSVITMT